MFETISSIDDEASSAAAACALAPFDTCIEAVRDGLAGRRHLAGDGANVGDRSRQARHHGTESLHQLVLRGPLADGHRQVAIRNLLAPPW